MQIINKVFLWGFILLVISIPAGMLYTDWSGKNNAKNACREIKSGEVFYGKKLLNKAPIFVDEKQEKFYLYIFPANFDFVAECKIYINEKNLVIRTETNLAQ